MKFLPDSPRARAGINHSSVLPGDLRREQDMVVYKKPEKV